MGYKNGWPSRTLVFILNMLLLSFVSYYFPHLLCTLHFLLHYYIVKSSFCDCDAFRAEVKAVRQLWWGTCWNPDASHVKGSYCSSLFNADEIPRDLILWPNISQRNSLDIFIEGFCQTARITSLLSNLLPYWIWKIT